METSFSIKDSQILPSFVRSIPLSPPQHSCILSNLFNLTSYNLPAKFPSSTQSFPNFFPSTHLASQDEVHCQCHPLFRFLALPASNASRSWSVSQSAHIQDHNHRDYLHLQCTQAQCRMYSSDLRRQVQERSRGERGGSGEGFAATSRCTSHSSRQDSRWTERLDQRGLCIGAKRPKHWNAASPHRAILHMGAIGNYKVCYTCRPVWLHICRGRLGLWRIHG